MVATAAFLDTLWTIWIHETTEYQRRDGLAQDISKRGAAWKRKWKARNRLKEERKVYVVLYNQASSWLVEQMIRFFYHTINLKPMPIKISIF